MSATGVLATQASVGPTRVGCYFLIVIATAGAGGFYRSTGLLVGIVARSVDNRDRSLGRIVVRRQRLNRQLPLSLTVDSRRSLRGVQLSLGGSGHRPSIHHTTSKVERGEAQQPTTGSFVSLGVASAAPRFDGPKG